ncbi:glutathione S-transferase N-terminal domain-containing protein [Candidatus Woesearchaeota archaeon]|nr:glutathione S-transferase N-terminal domain-containing protein [Candidatus Woesearchaeota archaeon]
MVKVIMYGTKTCPFCKKTREFFKEHKVRYKDFYVEKNKKARDEMIKKSGQMGVPVIDIDGTIIVGYAERTLKKLLKIGG